MVWCHVTAVVMVCVKSRFANKVLYHSYNTNECATCSAHTAIRMMKSLMLLVTRISA